MRNDEKEVSILESEREHLSRDLPSRGQARPRSTARPEDGKEAPGWPGGDREGRVGRTGTRRVAGQ